jgi:primosomal protein N' (replication factor Y) (superfamily II helicase)
MSKLFADVILPLPVAGKFSYLIPEGITPSPGVGKRVIVQFGQKKFHTAIISSIHSGAPEGFDAKEIISVLDDTPVVSEANISFWEWLANYYCCTMGEVMNAALPAGMKPESSTRVALADGIDFKELSRFEAAFLDNLGYEFKPIKSLQKDAAITNLFPAIKSLLKKGYIKVEEDLDKKYKAKTGSFICLSPEIKSEEILNEKIGHLKRAAKQEELLLHFCSLTKPFSADKIDEISIKNLFKETRFTQSHLNGLIKKGILAKNLKQVSRLGGGAVVEQGELALLNAAQEEALRKIKNLFKGKETTLLHGVTSSGKTEIYTHLIDEVIKTGKQVLYLVPEISLTTQLVARLKKAFGNKIGVYHSKLNHAERVEIWEKVLGFSLSDQDSYQVILGARSSVFLPFQNLGLIIVDEEHENSFKQFDPNPRYNARDVAVLLGTLYKCNVLLGSATPSFETYFNVKSGKFGLVELNQRYGDLELPEVVVSDLQKAYKRKQMKLFLAPDLFNEISESLGKKEQVILFQNRRGYSPYIECINCGWLPKCQNCDVSLTYHKQKKQLVCHYCGYHIPVPEICPSCGSPGIKTRGMGTEKIEEGLKSLFPEAKIARMDLDTTRGKNAIDRLIHDFENKKTDILVGTQMITKGLDFEHVRVVGILNADNLINFPDFRAHERSYQLISQVSGRAGRKHKKGTVVIQTTQPEHQVISEISRQAYDESFSRQVQERKLFKYPPYFRLIKITVKNKNEERLNAVSKELAVLLRENKNLLVLGPEFPLISRIKLWYQKEIWIKLHRDNHLGENKNFILKCINTASHSPNNSSTAFNIDVDPM